ncbi:MAG: sugar ABC transporter permease [Oscillospiraceae bacterium]|nr:sugar ABC transporter permease [Oscillospiraceae bacterium]
MRKITDEPRLGDGLGKKRNKINREIYGLYFILPFLVALLLFRFIPMVYTAVLSFTNWDGFARELTFVGFDNYQRLLTDDPLFFRSLFNTFILWFMHVFPRMAIALLCAVLFAQSRIRGRQFFQAVFYFPNLVTASSIAVLALLILNRQVGFLNQVLVAANLVYEPINWLGVPNNARGVVAFLIWWMWFGHSTILLTSGVLSIPRDVVESSMVDGANAWQRFWLITMPLLRPTFAFVFTTSLIGGLQNFDIPHVLDHLGDPNRSILTTVMHMFNMAFHARQFGYGSAIAIALFVVILVVSTVLFKFINRREEV